MKLEPGEVICPVCKGSGKLVGNNPKNFKPKTFTFPCNKCLGTGKLDWIEMCMGKKDILIWGQVSTTMTLPKIRNMYPKLIAKELVSVQPIDWSEKNERD